ncbi:MAG: hypothetical protein ABIA21_02075, partial [Candidatus Aenigmatarchaeota archaeon]
ELDEFSDINHVRTEISHKIFDFSENIVEPLIWCTQHCHSVERDMLTKDEYGDIFYLYKKIQSLRWRNHVLKIRPDKNETAKWIRDMWTFWKDFEPKVTKLCDKFSKGWETVSFKENPAEYHG